MIEIRSKRNRSLHVQYTVGSLEPTLYVIKEYIELLLADIVDELEKIVRNKVGTVGLEQQEIILP